jgi:hypothetical protein
LVPCAARARLLPLWCPPTGVSLLALLALPRWRRGWPRGRGGTGHQRCGEDHRCSTRRSPHARRRGSCRPQTTALPAPNHAAGGGGSRAGGRCLGDSHASSTATARGVRAAAPCEHAVHEAAAIAASARSPSRLATAAEGARHSPSFLTAAGARAAALARVSLMMAAVQWKRRGGDARGAMPVFSTSCAIVVTHLRALTRLALRSRARPSAVPPKSAQTSAAKTASEMFLHRAPGNPARCNNSQMLLSRPLKAFLNPGRDNSMP